MTFYRGIVVICNMYWNHTQKCPASNEEQGDIAFNTYGL
jgi:hypothetical protein